MFYFCVVIPCCPCHAYFGVLFFNPPTFYPCWLYQIDRFVCHWLKFFCENTAFCEIKKLFFVFFQSKYKKCLLVVSTFSYTFVLHI